MLMPVPCVPALPRFGCYNTDTGGKKTLQSEARDSRRFYAASFDSEVGGVGGGCIPMGCLPVSFQRKG
jgi:hypothetical protein